MRPPTEDEAVDRILHTTHGTFHLNCFVFIYVSYLCFVFTYVSYLFMFQSWIISYFSRIHGFHIDPVYVDAMPRAARYVLQWGNNAVEPYRGYLDRTMHDDITWRPFSDYTQIVPFDGISLYSGWLACGT